MSAARSRREQSSLFDLEPGDEERQEEERPEEETPATEAVSEATETGTLDLPLRGEAEAETSRGEERSSEEAAAEESKGRTSSARDRFFAGLLDLGLHVAVATVLLGALWLLGIPVDGRTFVALGIVLLAFSFFYTVIPLAFWRATPGMAAQALVSRAEGGEPLTFGQATRRWLAGVLTVILAGIPALALLTGRSLGDRWSGSSTVRSGPGAPA